MSHKLRDLASAVFALARQERGAAALGDARSSRVVAATSTAYPQRENRSCIVLFTLAANNVFITNAGITHVAQGRKHDLGDTFHPSRHKWRHCRYERWVSISRLDHACHDRRTRVVDASRHRERSVCSTCEGSGDALDCQHEQVENQYLGPNHRHAPNREGSQLKTTRQGLEDITWSHKRSGQRAQTTHHHHESHLTR